MSHLKRKNKMAKTISRGGMAYVFRNCGINLYFNGIT